MSVAEYWQLGAKSHLIRSGREVLAGDGHVRLQGEERGEGGRKGVRGDGDGCVLLVAVAVVLLLYLHADIRMQHRRMGWYE